MASILSPTKSIRTPSIKLVRMDELKPHERVNPEYLRELKEEIRCDGVLKFAIAVNKNRNIILDGHHRVAALKELGCTKIPVIFVDYSSSDIEVQSQKNGIHLTKEKILKAGLGLKKLPPKTSKHMIKVGDSMKHLSAIEKRVDVPLEKLKEEDDR